MKRSATNQAGSHSPSALNNMSTTDRMRRTIDLLGPSALGCVMATGDAKRNSPLVTPGGSDAGLSSVQSSSDHFEKSTVNNNSSAATVEKKGEAASFESLLMTLPLVQHCKQLKTTHCGLEARDGGETSLSAVLDACAMLPSCDHVAFFQRVRLRWKRSDGRTHDVDETMLARAEVAPPRNRDYSPFSASGYGTNRGKTVPLLLPPQQGVPRKTLVLDLDETLVRSIPIEPFDLQSGSDDDEGDIDAEYKGSQAIRYGFSIEGSTNEFIGDVSDASTTTMYVHCRPQLESFLSQVSALFEVVVFSSRGRQHTNAILDRIDPNHRLIQHRLYREHCLHDNTEKNICVKDISLLGRPLDQLVIVDDTPMNYMFQPYNAIPVSAWLADDATDVMLPDLMTLLREIASAGTVYDVLDDLTGAYCRRQTVAGLA